MSDLVGNHEDRLACVAAPIVDLALEKCTLLWRPVRINVFLKLIRINQISEPVIESPNSCSDCSACKKREILL